MIRRKRDRMQRGSAMAEFGPVMWLFFIFILFPFLDLISFASGVTTVMFMANMASRQAASATTFGDAVNSAYKTEQQLTNFMKFARLTPTGGAQHGVTVQVQVSPLSNQQAGTLYSFPLPGGTPSGYPANWPGPIPNANPDQNPSNPDDTANYQPNTGNTVYQYVVTASYDVAPLFNFNNIAILKTVPALGAPVPTKFVSTGTVEHPHGLNSAATN